MPEPRTDPLDALRAPFTPVAPDPAFAADLRARLLRAMLAPTSTIRTTKEPHMSIDLAARPRNGVRHGDVSYLTLGLPDLGRGRAFYGAVLGWRFSPGSSEDGAQVEDIVPMTGLWGGGQLRGAVLGFRVDDIVAAVRAVRAHGGTISDPHQEPYALAAEGRDDQGLPFYLHQLPAAAGASTAADKEFHNGDVEGDISYLTMVVPDLEAAYAFYRGVLGWAFNIGRAGGAQVTGVAPQIGLTTEPEAGPADRGVIVCYRVDDIAGAVTRVRRAGGRARDVAQRPYGLEALCTDDQGTPFYLHQLSGQ